MWHAALLMLSAVMLEADDRGYHMICIPVVMAPQQHPINMDPHMYVKPLAPSARLEAFTAKNARAFHDYTAAMYAIRSNFDFTGLSQRQHKTFPTSKALLLDIHE